MVSPNMRNKRTITKISTWLAGVVALLVVCLPPLSYGIFSYQYLQGSVTTEAEINSRIITNFINANPLLWQYEQLRLEELLARRPDSGEKESRRLLDLQGRLIAASDSPLPPPLFKTTHDVMDAGQAVARLEIARSLQPLLLKTGVAALIGLFLGVALFIPLRILPIRALKKAEKEREQYFSFFRISGDLMCIADPHGSFLKTNPAFKKTLGYSEEELISKPILEFVHPDDRQAALDEIERQQRSGSTDSIKIRYLCKDGSIKWLSWRINVGKEDRIIYATARDITERKKAEEALMHSEAQLRTIFETSRAGIIMVGPQGTILLANNSMAEMFGVSLNQLIGSPYADNLHPDERRHGENLMFKLIQGEIQEVSVERLYSRADGSNFWGFLSAKRMENHDGSLNALVGIIADITEQKTLREQLSHAQKIESIGLLAGGVAHDFNNMLGVILGHTELALMKADPSNPFIQNLEEIRTAAKHSADLTRQLLTFARKQVISPKVLDLNETVAGMLKMLQRLIGENIHLSWNPASSLWQVKIDPSQLDQILANLCVNSRDAIGGIGKIVIETQNCTFNESDLKDYSDALPGDYVQLSVSDDGHGMDKATLSQIFEPFFTTKEFGQGTGLGLSTVFGAVKQNDGFIEVSSEPDLGTTFHIYLPRNQATAVATTKATTKPLRQGNETVLLVEDDPMLLTLVNTMLEECGYTVLSAATTELAISLAKEKEGPIHLLLSDLVMPDMNGKDLRDILQLIRPEIKVIFMSGYTADIIAKQGVLEEGIHFLQKPISFDALTAKLREVLDAAS